MQAAGLALLSLGSLFACPLAHSSTISSSPWVLSQFVFGWVGGWVALVLLCLEDEGERLEAGEQPLPSAPCTPWGPSQAALDWAPQVNGAATAVSCMLVVALVTGGGGVPLGPNPTLGIPVKASAFFVSECTRKQFLHLLVQF